MRDLAGIAPIDAARLVVAVGAYRALHDVGPSWRQAAHAAGWTWLEQRGRRGAPNHSVDLAERMYLLRRAGLVTFTRDPRSLDITAAGCRWALATLDRKREATTT